MILSSIFFRLEETYWGHSSSHFLIQKVIQKWKKNIDLFLEPRSLPESDGHRDHGGIGGSKNKYFFLIVFQRLMP